MNLPRPLSSIAGLLIGVLVVGCRPLEFPDPVIEWLEPSFVVSGQSATVTVHGHDFFGAYDVSVGAGFIRNDSRYEGFITNNVGDVLAPASVTRIDERTLTVRLDAADMASVPGSTDRFLLLVSDSTGNTARAPLQVLPRAPTQLVVATQDPPHLVNEPDGLEILLLDQSEQRVQVNTPVCLFDAGRRRDDSIFVSVQLLADPGPACPPLPDGTVPVQVDVTTTNATASFQGLAPGQAQIGAYVPGTQLEADDDQVIIIHFGEATSVRLPPNGWSVRVPTPTMQVAPVDSFGAVIPTRVDVARFDLVCRDEASPVVLDSLFNVGLSGATLLQWNVTRPCTNALVFSTLGEVSTRGRIVPGPRTNLVLDLDRAIYPEVRAGEPFAVTITPYDDFGNPSGGITPDFNEFTVEVTSASKALTQTPEACSAVAGNTALQCVVSTTLATPNETLHAEIISLGIGGSLEGVEVLPSEHLGDVVITAPSVFSAGVSERVSVQLVDIYGNVMDPTSKGEIVLVGDLADTDCVDTGEVGPAGLEFACTLTEARDAGWFVTSVDGVQGLSSTFKVQNGPLAVTTFDTPATAVAGDEVTVELRTFDAWMNPYVVQGDATLSLTDEHGTWSTPSVTVDASGAAVVTGTFTLADETFLVASQDAMSLGFSDEIVVEAAATSGLQVALQAPWVVVDQSEIVEVEAVDTYGNRTSWSGAASLQSRHTGSPGVGLWLVNGVGRVRHTWTQFPGLTDVLDATTAQWVGESGPVVVVRDCPAGGPSGAATLDGHDVGVACVDPATGTGTVTVDMSSSTAGNASLLGYAWSVDDEAAQASTVSTTDLELSPGGHTVDLLVIDVDGCADVVATSAWVGLDDGTPVGPLPLAALDTELEANSDSVTIELSGVQDCTRGAASGQNVRVRSTAGALSGGPNTSGAGLELTLDASGDGSFSIDTSGGLSDGTLEVHAWVASGAAGGLLTLPLVGDDVPPVVVSQTPAGEHTSVVDEVRVVFSEPLVAADIDGASFDLAGPSGVDIGSVVLESPGDRVRVRFATGADGAAGAWWLTGYGADLVDGAGNQLSGDWSGSAEDFEGAFGDVGATVDSVLCSPTPANGWFRPDGDDGDGREADELEIALESDSAPAWWVMDVTDAYGTLVFHTRWVPTGGDDTIGWDGRGFDGMVMPNGVYTVAVAPDDGLGNRGAGCTVSAGLDNARGTPR